MPLLASLFGNFVFRPVLKPLIRVVTGLVAIPVFRFLLRRVFRLQMQDAELERDLEMWFRGAILLLAATANLEDILFSWLPWHLSDRPWLMGGLRLLLAVGVIESMPDQDIFAVLHRGPPKIRWTPAGLRRAWEQRLDILRGFGILHLKRSSPVFAIMCVIFGGGPGTTTWNVGWVCYGLAVTQYLIIGLITCRDRAGDVLALFDDNAAEQRALLTRHAAGVCGGAALTDDPTAGLPSEH